MGQSLIDMAKKKEEKIDLQEALEDIKQRFGEGAIMKLSESGKVTKTEVISTGSPSLDEALGVGGVPKGRVIEIYGIESSGKTTLALHIIAQAQKKGGIGAFVDAEHALDPDYAKRIGVDIKELLISQPDSGEQALQIVEALVRSNEVDVIVIDSVAALTPKAEVAGEIGEFQIGLQARLMSSALRKLSSIVSKSNTTVVFLNQIRMKIGVVFGCFSYDTKVMLADGSKERIGKIANQQLPVNVLSYNFKEKRIESKPIIDWHINGETGEFLQFFVQNHTGNGRRGFSCTPEHKIHTLKGWRKARDLNIGDEITTLIQEAVFTTEQEQAVIGSLLGDGNLKKINEQTAYFREEYGPKQAQYVEWLAGELGNLTSNLSLETSRGNAILETKHLLKFGDLKTVFYPKGKKIVPEEIVETITPRALALWYCGDGTLNKGTSKWKGKIYQGRPSAGLYVNGFSDTESRDRITRIFQRFDLYPTWRSCGEYKVLHFRVAEARKLFELIAPFMPLSMQYKLPDEYKGRYKDSANKTKIASLIQVVRPIKIKEIRGRIPSYQNGQRISRKRFDISVADNHNYFVDGCLVSNSPETTSGGLALKFYSSVRIELRRVAQIKHGEEVIGSRVRAKVIKNKVAAPFKNTEFDIYYNEGISFEADLINMGIKKGVIKKSGSWLQYGNEKLGQGFDAARNKIKEDETLAKSIRESIFKVED